MITDTNDAWLEQLIDKPGFARVRGNPHGGRTDELRYAERLRGDTGGGPREDGTPDVPHHYGEHIERRLSGA
jgi:hypothetical protein